MVVDYGVMGCESDGVISMIGIGGMSGIFLTADAQIRLSNAVIIGALFCMDGHRKLQIWQLARELVSAVYEIVRGLPPFERCIVSSQLCRAAWSVQNNIAEGNAKLGRAEMRRFFDVALGSLAEIDSMVTTLPDLYPVDSEVTNAVDRLRIRIAAGIFGMLRRGR